MTTEFIQSEIDRMVRLFDDERPSHCRASSIPEIVSLRVEADGSLIAIVFAEMDRTYHTVVFSAVVADRINQYIADANRKWRWTAKSTAEKAELFNSIKKAYPPPFYAVSDPDEVPIAVSANLLADKNGSILTLRLESGEDCAVAMKYGVTLFLFQAIAYRFDQGQWRDQDGNLAPSVGSSSFMQWQRRRA